MAACFFAAILSHRSEAIHVPLGAMVVAVYVNKLTVPRRDMFKAAPLTSHANVYRNQLANRLVGFLGLCLVGMSLPSFWFLDSGCHTFFTRVSFLRFFLNLRSINLTVTTFPGVGFDGTTTAAFEVIAMSSNSTSPASTSTYVSSKVGGDTDRNPSTAYQPLGGSRLSSFNVTFFHCSAGSFWNRTVTGKNSSAGDTGECLLCTDGIDGEIEVRHDAICDFLFMGMPASSLEKTNVVQTVLASKPT